MELGIMLLLLGAFTGGFGLLGVLRPDIAWRWQKFENDLQGVVSRRSSRWDAWQRFGAHASTAIGATMMFAGGVSIAHGKFQQNTQKMADAISVECTLEGIELYNLSSTDYVVQLQNFMAVARLGISLPMNHDFKLPSDAFESSPEQATALAVAPLGPLKLPAGQLRSHKIAWPKQVECNERSMLGEDLLGLRTGKLFANKCSYVLFEYQIGTESPDRLRFWRSCPLPERKQVDLNSSL